MMLRFPKATHTPVGKHFEASEFDCRCKDPECKETVIDTDLISKLDCMADDLGVPVYITSGNRCAAYEQELKDEGYETADGISQHELAKAADLRTGKHTGDELAASARRAGFKAIGIGKRFIHCDLRADRERCWTYSY